MLKIVCHNSRDAAGAVCALLNGSGGVVVCDSSINILKLRFAIRPTPPPFGVVSDGKEIHVAAGQDKPYSANGRFSILDGDSVRIADGDDIRDMLMVSSVAPTRWERQFSDVVEFGDFDHSELNLFAQGLKKEGRCDFESELEHIGLMRRGRFTNAADVLLCHDVAARQPQTRATAVAFEDKGDSVYKGHCRAEGFLIDVFNQLWAFFLQHACSFQTFDDANPHREAVYRFPPKAVKEGLINALAHRDYESYAGGVKLEIGKGELVITNAGGLFGGIKVEQLELGHVFAFRNPDIANYLTIRGFMEMIGRGVLVIREECKKAGLPTPKWDCFDSQVKLTIYGNPDGSAIMPQLDKKSVFVQESLGEINPYDVRNQHDGCSLGVSWWPESWPKTWPESWPKEWPGSNENKILSLLYFGAMSKKELAEMLGVSADANSLKQALWALQDERKFIEPTLKDKPTSPLQKYRITTAGVSYIQTFTTLVPQRASVLKPTPPTS